MKGLLTALALLSITHAGAQTTLVTWDFPNFPDDAVADAGIASNTSKTLNTGGSTSAMAFNTAGNTTRAASATGWDNGNGAKYWEVSFTTTGYSGITLSSKQKSNTAGPANFKVQYKIGAAGTYADVTGGTITTTSANWTSGILSALALPTAVDNQSAVYIRWIMNSNLSTNGGTVSSGGLSQIDDIVIQATTTSLPLHLQSFDGTPGSECMSLKWTVACEISLSGYDVEKSVNGAEFTAIAKLPAKNYGCGTEAAYKYNDGTFSGNVLYRLKITEQNGSFYYSPVRYFRNAQEGAQLGVFPNPAGDVIFIQGLSAGASWYITDSYGRIVVKGIVAEQLFSIPLTNLPAGTYFFRVSDQRVMRFVKQ